MAVRKKTYGVNFPFYDSNNGDFLQLTPTIEAQVKSDLIHLLLTRKGSRYFLPDFGTNLYQYIFEPLDEIVIQKIEDEINNAVEKYIPNLQINKINITQFYNNIDFVSDDKKQHSVTVNIDYTVNFRTFQSPDTVTLTL
jgi:phage baseplate assembly protein W